MLEDLQIQLLPRALKELDRGWVGEAYLKEEMGWEGGSLEKGGAWEKQKVKMMD